VSEEAEPYLVRLTNRLLEGVERLPADVRARTARYLLEAQNPDGGFSGREGGSDLYYTGFALRSLAVLQALNADVCGKAAGFLRSKLSGSAGVVDFFSLVVSCYLVPLGGGPDVLSDAPLDWKDRVASTLESFRSPDGGYGKTPAAPHGSTYTSFLVTLCLQLLGKPTPDGERLAVFVRSRRRPDGGYVEISAMKRSGTNPTAAGVGLLQILGGMTDDERRETADFLAVLPSSFASRPRTCFRRSPAVGRWISSVSPPNSIGRRCENTLLSASGRSGASAAACGTTGPTWSTRSTGWERSPSRL